MHHNMTIKKVTRVLWEIQRASLFAGCITEQNRSFHSIKVFLLVAHNFRPPRNTCIKRLNKYAIIGCFHCPLFYASSLTHAFFLLMEKQFMWLSVTLWGGGGA